MDFSHVIFIMYAHKPALSKEIKLGFVVTSLCQRRNSVFIIMLCNTRGKYPFSPQWVEK